MFDSPTYRPPLPPQEIFLLFISVRGCVDPSAIKIIIIWIGVLVPLLPPGSTAASVAYCTSPRLLNVPTLAARCLSRPQPTVVP